MFCKKKILILIAFLSVSLSFFAQKVKQNASIDSVKVNINKNIKFNYKQLAIPTILIGYGVWATDNDQLEFFNLEIKEEVLENIDDKFTIDDFSQYVPLATALSLDAIAIKGKNNFKDKVIISATSYLIMGIVVSSTKKIAHVERPDGSSVNSFPSGHTATAFMGAELLHQEYKDISLWYSISGYLVLQEQGFLECTITDIGYLM